MRSLLVYISPDKKIPELDEKEIKIQIDSFLFLGHGVEDIELITNFEWEYNGVSSYIRTEGFTYFNPPSTKFRVLADLFREGKIDGIYWSHDLDAFPQYKITDEELGLDEYDLGLCTYGRNDYINLGSLFVKQSAEDIVLEIDRLMEQYPGPEKGPKYDEFVIHKLLKENFNDIQKRAKILNGTYDFGMRRIAQCYEKAEKPLKVVHFRPYSDMLNTLGRAMYGRNEVGVPLMNPDIIKIFERHGIK